jgi:hypothetical protein
MCKNHSKKRCCLGPEQRKANPGDCSPEQIKECHGNDKKHPCENDGKEDCGK